MIIILWLCFLSSSATPLKLAEDILNELSWTIRLKIIELKLTTPAPPPPSSEPQNNDYSEPPSTASTTVVPVTVPVNATINDGYDRRRNFRKSRRVGIEAFRQGEHPKPTLSTQINEPVTMPVEEGISADENNMRLKLFRLMYETMRDSDVKVKRAELIQVQYSNLTSFQVGYLIGDITDKFATMNDIRSTLTRFYEEWKPIEHINAYEQIANQAIEIGHLINLMNVVIKRDVATTVRTKSTV